MKNVEDLYPLSPLQQGLLFHALMEPESPAYVNQCSFALRRLDAALFRETWERVVARHAILRTAFVWEGLKEPLQAVRQRLRLPLEEQDWRGLEPRERSRRLESLRAAERSRPLPLSKAPLMRLVLLRIEEDAYELLWTFHHLLLDGWSTSLLFEDVSAIYRALREGRPPALPPVRPYRDYIAWLQRQEPGAAEGFWRRYLAGVTAPTPLGPDRAGTGAALSSAERSATLPAATAADLQSLAVRHRLTLNTLGQGMWALLLARCSGEEDVVFGSVVSGRPADLPGVESMIGLFINTLPVRLRVAAAEQALSWLERLQREQIELRQHEQSHLARIQQWSEMPRGRALFDSILACENYPRAQAAAAPDRDDDFQVARARNREQTGYALSVSIVPRNGLTVEIAYDPTRFDAASIARRAAQLCNLLAGLLEPAPRVEDLPLLSAAERHQLLLEWSDTAVVRPREDLPFPRRFEEQARRSPSAVAAACAGELLTYGELDERAARWAGRLARRGIGAERVVGLLAERGLPLLTAILAVFKAGGAYLPLDPRHPAARQRTVLAQSGAALVLAEQSLAADLLLAQALPVLEIEELVAGEPAPFAGRCAPQNLAYVIFTSGSTGVPKGAMVEHRGMLNHLSAKIEDLGLSAADVVVQSASQCFDISVWQLLAVLLAGGRVEIADDATAHDPQRLLELVEREGATILETVPSLLRGVLEVLEASDARPKLGSLRWLVVTGEAFPAELARRWLALFPAVGMLNAYGPTECSDDVTHWAVPRPPQGAETQVAIGRPVANFRLDVLDRRLRPVPLGLPGELCVGGSGVGRGYLGKPARTADVFVPDPQGALRGEPGGRLYRTGDLVRRRADGVLEFLGRIDHQVKVRGYRIELGEIEAALERHPGVRAAVVLAQEEEPGQVRLVAYVVPAGASGMAGALRAHLRGELPEYMVPAALVEVPELPLLPSGKVDRRALGRSEPVAEIENTLFKPARGPIEELLAGIWAEVLRRERISSEESFFDLGGHSLLATQVTSRIRQLFGVEVAIRSLFEAPTVGSLARVVASALGAARGIEPPPLAPAPRLGPSPLSFAQQRLWVLDQLEAGPAYNIPAVLRLPADLSVPALVMSLSVIVRRHEVLRTAFVAPAGEAPVQMILPAAPVALPVVDLSGLPAHASPGEVRRLSHLEVLRPFDLARAPLLRVTLLRLARAQILLGTMHHIVSDGWSMEVLGRELSTLYDAFRSGLPSPLPELPIQYADFAIWQRHWLAGPVLERQLAYWRQCLHEAPPCLVLPMDRPRPAVQGSRGMRRPLRLSEESSSALRALARRERATPFITVLAGFAALLSRYSASADLCIGTPVSGRHFVEIERLIGFFVNTLVLRIDLAGGPGLSDLVGRVRATALDAQAHQDLPFEKLVEELRPERNLGATPLFQVMFDLAYGGVAGRGVPVVEEAVVKFDLTLSMVDVDGPLFGTLEHSADLFDGSTAERMLDHLGHILESAVAAPQRSFQELPLLSAEQRAQLLVEWSGRDQAKEPVRSLLDLLAEQVAVRPDAAAVESQGSVLTYLGLTRWAARLAQQLQGLGVRAESRVGLHLERSPAMVAALLGVLMAGGAFVPIDPRLPVERRRLLLADAGIAVVVVETQEPEDLAVQSVPMLRLARLPVAGEPPSPEAPDESTAYVIYTSGSTGRPKGVMVSRRSLTSFASSTVGALGIGAADRILQLASLSFDASLEEIFPCLLGGGTLVLRTEAMLGSVPSFLAACAERNLTVLDLPTAFWHEVARGMETEDLRLPAAVRLVIIGGEQALAGDLEIWHRQVGAAARLVNTYGPTEATVVATASDLAHLPAHPPRPVPIGRSIPGVRTWVLDHHLEPAPPGVSGELWIGGEGLARGYLGRPDLSAERFVPEPFTGERGARMYRTGDTVRRRPSGELEFIGRLDHQVKIRGFRIEPGEIESALREHAGVREALVLSRAMGGDHQSLVAYVTGTSLTPAELRSHLRRRLPEHMVPSSFVVLPALPLTRTGKIDRRMLAGMPVGTVPEEAGDETGEVSRTPLEELLAGIFAEVLQTDRVDLEENFFEMGGHSLLATRLISQASRVLGVELPLRTVFEAPTVRALAGQVERMRQAGWVAQRPPLTRLPRDQRLPLSFTQQRLWRLQQREPESPAYNLRNAVRLHGSLDAAALVASLAEIVRRHEVLRTGFAAAAGEPFQVIAPPGRFLLPWIDLAGLPEEACRAEIRRLRKEDADRPFDLSRPPMLRAAVLALAGDDHIILLTFHEIAFDGLSMGILVRETGTLYEAFRRQRPSPLPELAVQYADFAGWQQQWLTGDVLEAELAYWRSCLGSSPQPLDLRADRPGPGGRAGTPAGRRRLQVDGNLLGKLRRIARQKGATLFMTLLAAFHTLLSRYADHGSISVGTPIGGRIHPQVEPLLGRFANRLVLRTSVAGDPDFSVLLERVRETALGAYAHQDVPFERVLAEYDSAQDHSRLFQVWFSLTPGGGELKLPGLRVGRLPAEDTALTYFDLSLLLVEEDGQLGGWMAYRKELFDQETIERRAAHLESLWREITVSPDRPLSTLLAEAERRLPPAESAGTAVPSFIHSGTGE